MHIDKYERFVLSACLLDRHAAQIVVTELSDNAFSYGADGTISNVHQEIYRAIVAVQMDGLVPDVATVAARLGKNLEKVGGMAYLTKLAQSLSIAGIYSTEGLPQWAQIVDKAGRLRNMSTIFAENLDKVKDTEKAMARIDDVDGFLSDVLRELADANTLKQEYAPIGDAVVKAKQILERQAKGETVTWFPIGWPSFSEYRLLPRRALFVLLGLTSIGKSQLLAQMVLGAAIQLRYENLPGVCVVNTYEMSTYQYALRMASCLSQVNLLSPEVGDVTSPMYKRLMGALEIVEDLPIYMSDGDMSSPQIINNIRLLEAQNGGIPVLGIDYAELVPDRNSSEEQRVSAIFRNAQLISRQTDACVIMLSQFPQSVYNDPHKLGIGLNPRYSGAGMHAAHVQAILYNMPQMRRQHIEFTVPEGMEPDYAWLVITKNKDGRVGQLRLNWKPECTQFSDPQLAGFGGGTLYKHMDNLQRQLDATEPRIALDGPVIPPIVHDEPVNQLELSDYLEEGDF